MCKLMSPGSLVGCAENPIACSRVVAAEGFCTGVTSGDSLTWTAYLRLSLYPVHTVDLS